MYNSTTQMINNYLKQQSTESYIDLAQSSFSLIITLAIWYKVMDFPAFFKSVRDKRAKQKKQKEKKEFEKMKVLFEAMKRDELEHISLDSDVSGDDEEKKDQDYHLKITRKKQKKPPSIV